jgi:hypothetical protein
MKVACHLLNKKLLVARGSQESSVPQPARNSYGEPHRLFEFPKQSSFPDAVIQGDLRAAIAFSNESDSALELSLRGDSNSAFRQT